VVVRPPTPEDLSALLSMWEELRASSGRNGPLAPAPSEQRLRSRLAATADEPGFQGVVAELDGIVVGMATFQVRTMGPFVDAPVVQIDYLHVRSGFQRKGVARALVAAATTFAEEQGAEHVSVHVLPQLREANRFYARLGFAPIVIRRVASVTTLRRRLGADPDGAAERAGRVARRRLVLKARSSRAAAPV
jgi:GNAT superfamily N-acetyltransferase